MSSRTTRRGSRALAALALALGLTLGLAGPDARPAAAASLQVHVAGEGDTLWTIARAHGCTVGDLERANGLRSRVLLRGQRLKIPRCAASDGTSPAGADAPSPTSTNASSTRDASTPSTRAASTRASSTRAASTRAASTLAASTLAASTTRAASTTPPAAAPEAVRHRVAKGESLARIAQRYGCSPTEIRSRNGLRGNTIHPGMELWIPRGAAAAGRFEAPIVRGQSVGKPHRGKLVSGSQVPAGKGYHLRRSARAWGTDHAIAYTLGAIETTRRRHPKLHRLAIGDLSRQDGGALPGHRSHQSGRDVDLGLYYRKRPPEYPREFAPGSARNLHVAATWTLVEVLLASRSAAGGVEHIFLDYELQRVLYEWAKDHGMTAKELAEVFQYPQGKDKGGTVIQHVPAHHDHLHVRFKCPTGDRGCQ